jgi:biopolymer transport protein ExbB/TolQ
MHLLHVTPVLANALSFAFEKATDEGKMTIGTLVCVSLFSWTVIISKILQLFKARRATKKFFAAQRATRDPLDLYKRELEFPGSPAYEVYFAGAEELTYHLKNNPIRVKDVTKISSESIDTIKVVLERTVSTQALALEKGMIVLSTAVAGGPFIGLLGTVWGVMETFSGVARAHTASLTAMAPGVAGALISTVVGLFVAIPAMFAYNFMVTSIRALTQELDNFTSEYATQISHTFADNRALADEIADSIRLLQQDSKRTAIESRPVEALA